MDEVSINGRRRVAEALLRTVGRAGIAGVSVRTVAAEAGVTGGTVQHHFPTRGEMMRYAMELISDRVEQRLTAMPRSGPVKEWTRSVLLELLPLSTERREEFSVWLAFIVHAETDPELTQLKQETTARLHALYSHIIHVRRGDAGPTVVTTPDATEGYGAASKAGHEATMLQAFVDGLSLHLGSMSIEEADRRGPLLLDSYLAAAVDMVHRSGR